MSRATLALVLGISCAAACSSSDEGYDGPGKDLVGDWIADGTHEVTVDGNTSSVGGTHEFRIYAEGEHLLIEDGACAFPGNGDGNDRISLMQSDSCVRNDVTGEALTYAVETGTASVAPGQHFTLEISGQVRPLGGEANGTFSIVYVGQPAGGGGGNDGDGDGGDDEDGSGGGGGSGW